MKSSHRSPNHAQARIEKLEDELIQKNIAIETLILEKGEKEVQCKDLMAELLSDKEAIIAQLEFELTQKKGAIEALTAEKTEKAVLCKELTAELLSDKSFIRVLEQRTRDLVAELDRLRSELRKWRVADISGHGVTGTGSMSGPECGMMGKWPEQVATLMKIAGVDHVVEADGPLQGFPFKYAVVDTLAQHGHTNSASSQPSSWLGRHLSPFQFCSRRNQKRTYELRIVYVLCPGLTWNNVHVAEMPSGCSVRIRRANTASNDAPDTFQKVFQFLEPTTFFRFYDGNIAVLDGMLVVTLEKQRFRSDDEMGQLPKLD